MTIDQRISLSRAVDGPNPAEITAHFIPCRVHYSGPAPVSHFFRATEAACASDGTMTAYLRGRLLLGTRVTLPNAYRGTVYTPLQASVHATDDNDHVNGAFGHGSSSGGGLEEVTQWHAEATFRSMIAYGNGATPDNDNSGNKVLEWIRLANAIHGPE